MYAHQWFLVHLTCQLPRGKKYMRHLANIRPWRGPIPDALETVELAVPRTSIDKLEEGEYIFACEQAGGNIFHLPRIKRSLTWISQPRPVEPQARKWPPRNSHRCTLAATRSSSTATAKRKEHAHRYGHYCSTTLMI